MFSNTIKKKKTHTHTNYHPNVKTSAQEYVVDSVSIEGIHKTVAIWEYDKRSANGAKFVYYGMRLYESETGEREDELVKYMHSVLDALEIR